MSLIEFFFNVLHRVPDFSTTAFYGDQNNTNGTDCHNMEAWDWFYTSQPVYILIVAVLGIMLNVFVLLVFCLHKKACTVAEIYLSNLAAADLLLVCCLPFWAVNISHNFDWPFGEFLCKIVNVGIKMNTDSSIYLLVLVSIDRYVALVHTMSYGQMRRPKYAKLGCLLMWTFGFLLNVPALIFRRVQHFPEYSVNACFLDYPNPTVRLFCEVVLVVCSFVIPFSIISFCTVKIIQTLRIKAIERLNAEKTEQKATTLMLVVLLAFLVCWVPFHIITILDLLYQVELVKGCHLSHFLEIANQVFTYFAFFNSVLNPILYVIVGKNFRKKVAEVFSQWRNKKGATSETYRLNLSSDTVKTLA